MFVAWIMYIMHFKCGNLEVNSDVTNDNDTFTV